MTEDANERADDEPLPRRRLPWLRAALFAVFVASLPFTWTEHVAAGCSGEPLGPPILSSGWARLVTGADAGAVLLLLAIGALVADFGAARTRRWLRLAIEFLGALFALGLAGFAQFAANFELFGVTRLRAAAYLGLGALGAILLEAIVRTALALFDAVRAFRRRR